MESGSELAWLMAWYAAQCDDDWEHSYGVKLETLDNPGWQLEIDLADTPHEDRALTRVSRDMKSETSWSTWVVEAKKFSAACGPLDLPEVLAAFRRWVEAA